MIDCHCHLDEFLRDGELDAVLSRAENAGVRCFVAAGTQPADWKIYGELAAAFPQKIFYTVGLHPTEIGDDPDAQLAALEKYFCGGVPAPSAIGEIGLDRHWLPENPDEAARVYSRQREVFERQLAFAKKLGVPVVIHSREAFADSVAAIDASGVDWNAVDFHCFSEDEAEMRELNIRGGRGSFTGILTYKNAEKTRRAALAQGLERAMIETDCPFLAPREFRGKRNEPAYLRATAQFAAELFGVAFEDFAALTEANTRAFFRF